MTKQGTGINETKTCGRCGGTGSYPSHVWQGRCFSCGGSGKVATAAALKARSSLPKVEATELRSGDVILVGNVAGTRWGHEEVVVSIEVQVEDWRGYRPAQTFVRVHYEDATQDYTYEVGRDLATLVRRLEA